MKNDPYGSYVPGFVGPVKSIDTNVIPYNFLQIIFYHRIDSNNQKKTLRWVVHSSLGDPDRCMGVILCPSFTLCVFVYNMKISVS